MSEAPGRDEEVTLRLTWDGDVDAGYLYLTAIGPGEAVTQRAVANPVGGGGEVILDFDREGKLLGIEMLGRANLPLSLSEGTRWDGARETGRP